MNERADCYLYIPSLLYSICSLIATVSSIIHYKPHNIGDLDPLSVGEEKGRV